MSAIDSLKIIIFSEDGIKEIKKLKTNVIVTFLLSVFILSFPSSYSNLTNYLINFLINFVVVAVLLSLLIGIIYLFAKFLGSPVKFLDYFRSLSFTMFVTSFLSIVLAFLLINLGMIIGQSDIAIKLVSGSFITYYFFVVFSWCAERFADFDNLKGVILGLITLSLNYIFHLILSFLP